MTTHVFYAPHPDDEVLGMAGAIALAKAAGERVILALVTNSLPSPRAERFFSGAISCPWHGKIHLQGPAGLLAARLVEFNAAAAVLGVDSVTFLGIHEREEVADQPAFVGEILDAIQRLEAKYPGAEHHLVASPHDLHFETRAGNNSHRACWEAAVTAAAMGNRVHLHRVYTYSFPIEERRATIVLELPAPIMALKRRALECYRVWDPAAGRLAYGYHSVPELFDAAHGDAREFLDLARSA